MLFNFTRNRQHIFQVLDHGGLGEEREVLHELEHQAGPRVGGVVPVVGDELLGDLVEDLVGRQSLRFSSR